MEILVSIKFIDYPKGVGYKPKWEAPNSQAEGEDIVSLLQKYKRQKIKWGNLREETEGINIILKQANKSIPKDKFSAFEYGLYYIPKVSRLSCSLMCCKPTFSVSMNLSSRRIR